jgi:NTE family protein
MSPWREVTAMTTRNRPRIVESGAAAEQGGSAGLGAGQIVLVLQGGGALGAYQAGVYQALNEAGIEPDWVIGTSIGAINAGLIAGNKPQDRLAKLRQFWARVEHGPAVEVLGSVPLFGAMLRNYATIATGIGGFFEPNPLAFLGQQVPLTAETAGYYSTRALEQTLEELASFPVASSHAPRLTVGAANVRTGEMRYFDSRDMEILPRHVMASGALPPGFPAVRIDGELFWDGGVLSNTPVEAVFDDIPRRDSLIFAVHIWNPRGPEPETIWQVMNRHKDIQYASRAVSHIARQRQIHRLRHIIAELVKRLPEEERNGEEVRQMAGYGCLTRMHVVRLLAPGLEGEDHTKDIDFSHAALRTRWQAGHQDMQSALGQMPWQAEFDPLEGFILHEFRRAPVMTTGSATPQA